MAQAKIYLGRSIDTRSVNLDKLMKKAEAVATGLTVPAGVLFARFEHEGRAYALSARVSVEVEALSARVPDVIIREGAAAGRPAKTRTGKRGGLRS